MITDYSLFFESHSFCEEQNAIPCKKYGCTESQHMHNSSGVSCSEVPSFSSDCIHSPVTHNVKDRAPGHGKSLGLLSTPYCSETTEKLSC